MKTKIIALLACLLMGNTGLAQEVEMADAMRADGKIYVLVAIISTILLGLLIYLILIEKRVSKVEKRLSEKK